jgi:tetratricopeptide (TPR) repeat protein
MAARLILANCLLFFSAVRMATGQDGSVTMPAKARAEELNQRGTESIQANKFEEAKALFIQAIHDDPQLPDTYENLALLFLLEGDDTNAYGWAVRLVAINPDSYNGRFVAGVAAINQDKFWRARDYLGPLVAHDASDPLAIAAYTTALERTGDKRTESRMRTKLSSLTVDEHDALLAGQIFRESDLRDAAEKWLEAAVERPQQSRQEQVLCMLAAIYADQSRNAEAAALYEKALKISPGDVNVLVELSEIERQGGEREKSLAHLYTAKTLAATDGSTLLLFSQVCMRRHMYVDARDALEKVVAGDPHNREAWYQLGLAQFRIGEAESAAEDFRKALHLDPGDEWSRVGLGAVLATVGRGQEAMVELTRALKRDPHCSAAYYYLAQIHRNQGQLALASKELELAVLHAQQDARPLAALGQVQLARHDLRAARISLQRAIELDYTSATAHYNMAMLFRATGEIEEAKKEIELYKEYQEQESKKGIVGLARKGEWDYAGFMPSN